MCERALIKDRQLDGMWRYQKRLASEGRKPGRPSKVDPARVKKFIKKAGKTMKEIMVATDLSRATVYRALGR
jgi:DNA invertase Pin-like site-specific DNA recombinase